MPHLRIRFALCSLLCAVLFPLTSTAQSPSSIDWQLSLLRGTWEVHTFYQKWSLVFNSDSEVILDKEATRYTLEPGTLRLYDGDNATAYAYKLSGEYLTLTSPDGSEKTYRRAGSGDAEKNVRGDFFRTPDTSSNREFISFDGDHSFSARFKSWDSTQSHATVNNYHGVYRVVANSLLLTYDDGAVDQISIRSRDKDGGAAGVLYNDVLFERKIVREALPSPNVTQATTTIIVTQPEPADAPCICGIPWPASPVADPTPPPAYAAPTAKPAPAPAAQTEIKRDFGSKRGGRP